MALDGARYIISDMPSGAFEGHANKVAAFQDGAWVFLAPQRGWQAYNETQAALLVFTAAGWAPLSAGTNNIERTPRLGVNGSADDVNRLLVKSEASLLDNVGAGHQLKINKADEADTASLLFQSSFQGHAEMGLTGSNDFALKVSPDGAQFLDSVTLDQQTGDVSFPNGTHRRQLLETISLSGDGVEFYGFPNLATIAIGQGALTLVAGRVYFSPIYVDRPTEVTGGLVVISGASSSAGAVLRIGIFELGQPNGSNWQIGARRADFGTQPMDTAGSYDFSPDTPHILQPGWYMLAVGTDGAAAQIRYIQTVTPGQFQYAPSGTGTATRFRVVGPSVYAFISGQEDVIQSGFPADWAGQTATDATNTSIKGFSFFVPKFKHWNTA